ncbi:MAG TPA: beta-carotene 15,15'-monooxygenase [Clostridiaceae bacterium]|nr:beta-carotene 15,15'-monooxygenase [Clostridiaceae bacterium]
MTTLFSSTPALLAVITCMVAAAFYLQRVKLFKSLGPALTVIILGIILSNFKIVPVSTELYGTIMYYAIPVSVAIMILGVDLRGLMKISKQPLISIAIAVFSVSFVAFLAGLFFAPKIDEGWKVAGMFVGTYTGGSSNLNAIASGLEASSKTIAAANAADYVIGMPSLIFLFAAPAIIKKSKAFQKFWPYSVPDSELDTDDHVELMGSKEWSIKDIAWLFALGFAITAASTFLAGFAPAAYKSAVRILLITTIAVIVAQFKQVQKLKGNLDLGLYVALIFLSIIGFAVDLKEFFGSTLMISLFCFIVVCGSLILHLSLTRLFKIKYQYVLLGIVAAIADGPTAALVAASAEWKSLVSISVVLGVIGGLVGNYVGITVAYAIKAVLGM